MSVKYRIRLQNERVIGPFSAEEIGELYLKNQINGDEVCQQFPIGDWKKIENFPNLLPPKKAITEIPPQVKSEVGSSAQDKYKEFQFEKIERTSVDYAELEKKFKNSNLNSETAIEDPNKTRIVNKIKHDNSPELEKTVVTPWKQGMPIKQSDDTRKISISEIEKEQEEEENKRNEKIRLHQIEIIRTEEELINKQTEFFNLAQVLPTINAQLSASEVEFDLKARIEENQERMRIKELEQQRLRELDSDEFEDSDNQDEYEDEEQGAEVFDELSGKPIENKKLKTKRKKGMSLIVAIAFLAIFYVILTPDEKPKETGPRFIDIKFPITEEFENSSAASAALVQGRNFYSKNTYLNRVTAAQLFTLSLQKQFSNNEALGELILTYTELLADSSAPTEAANTIYKLIQLAENKMLSDLNVVTGTALFFGKIGKYQTGINVVKNYFRAKGRPSAKLLAYYLDLLVNADDLTEARITYNKLKAIPKKQFEVYSSLARFNEMDDQAAEARNIIEEGLKYYPQSDLLLLKAADYFFSDRSLLNFEETLKKVKNNNSERSPVFSASFYKNMGLLSAIKNKKTEATLFFKKSLAIQESDELRTMLSSLDVGGDSFSKSLILESKSLELLKKAKIEIKNKNIEAAFSYTIEAIDTYPDYVPAILLLTQLQLKKGLFDSAIDTLQKAISKNPESNLLKKNLVLAYVKTYKFDDAQKYLLELSQTKFASGGAYASLMGDFYYSKNNPQLAIRWYSEALGRDPLRDYDLGKLAKIYLTNKKFNESKAKLNKALLLDPKNPDYLAMNSEILFEQDSTDTAIGYLRDAISEIGEDPRLLSMIATLYYKSGQLKDFQIYYKRIQESPKKDETFYEFLLYAAKLEEKTEDYIKYSYELLKLNPGNLKIRLDLAEFLFQAKRFPEAIAELDEIRAKIESYPKVHFMLAKIFLETNDLKNAKVMALKELKLNPNLDSAYFIVGEVARIERDYGEAIIKFEKAISINPKSVDALMAMGWIKLAQNYANEAVELYTRALNQDKGNPEIFKQIGYSYKAAGQRSLAKEKFEDYLKLSPGAPDRDQIELQIKNLQ